VKITKFNIYRYAIPLISPIQIKHLKLKKRIGFIIEIEDETENTAYGEVAPLPGLHKEDMLSSLQQLKKLRSEFLNKELPSNLGRLEGEFEDLLSDYNLYPSVRFGIEMALSNLKINNSKQSIIPFYDSSIDNSIRLNGLVTGSREEIIKKVLEYLSNGYSAIKVKVGHKNIEEDVGIINAVVPLCKNRANIRLDANRAWSLEDAVDFGTRVEPKAIEYIEEPVKNSMDLSEFYYETKIPVALDETLVEKPCDFLEEFDWLKAIIIKPSVIGGFEKAKKWTVNALKHDIDPIFSNAFLSGVGLASIAKLVTTLKLNHLAMGLETFKLFKIDLPVEPFTVNNGQISVNDIYKRSLSIRKDLLEKV